MSSESLSAISGNRIVRTTGDHTSFELHVLAAAAEMYSSGIYSGGTLKSLSVVGDQSSIRAAWSLMSSNFPVEMIFSDNVFPDVKRQVKLTTDHTNGYKTKQFHMGYNLFHMVAIADDDCYLPRVTYNEVFAHLKSSKFTVPVIREWAPFIAGELRDSGKLKPFTSYNCNSGQIMANDADIEKIIKSGLKSRDITIPEA